MPPVGNPQKTAIARILLALVVVLSGAAGWFLDLGFVEGPQTRAWSTRWRGIRAAGVPVRLFELSAERKMDTLTSRRTQVGRSASEAAGRAGFRVGVPVRHADTETALGSTWKSSQIKMETPSGEPPRRGCRPFFAPLATPRSSNCSLELSEFARKMGAQYSNQHDLMRLLKHSAESGFLGPIAENPESADVIVVEDEGEHACFVLKMMNLSHRSWTPSLRESQIRRLVRRFPEKTVVAVGDHPWYNTAVVAPNLVVAVNDYHQARRNMRDPRSAVRRYVVMAYPGPRNEHVRDHNETEFKHLVFFVGACSPIAFKWSGKKLRKLFVAAARARNDSWIFAECADGKRAPTIPFPEFQKRLAQSKYCPVLAGDTSSSRRLTDVILAGCVPVFIGPPWAAFPMLPHVRYQSFSVFLRVREYQKECDRTSEANAWRWADDPRAEGLVGRNASHFIEVDKFRDVFEVLDAIPDAKFAAMRRAVREHMAYFSYAMPSDDSTLSRPAGKRLLDAVCEVSRVEM